MMTIGTARIFGMLSAAVALAGGLLDSPDGARAEGDAKCLHLVSYDNPGTVYSVNETISRNLIKVLRDAGICARVDYLPAARASSLLRSGEIDGEIARMAQYEDAVGDVATKVSEPLGKGVGYLLLPQDAPAGPIDPESFNLGTLNGYVWHQVVAQRYPHAVAARTYETLFKMLDEGRIEGMLIDGFTLDRLPNKDAFRAVRLAEADFFLYLHNSRQDLVPAVAAAIGDFKRSGRSFTDPSMRIVRAIPFPAAIDERRSGAASYGKH